MNSNFSMSTDYEKSKLLSNETELNSLKISDY